MQNCFCLNAKEPIFLGCHQNKDGSLDENKSLYLNIEKRNDRDTGFLRFISDEKIFEVKILYCPFCGRRFGGWADI